MGAHHKSDGNEWPWTMNMMHLFITVRGRRSGWVQSFREASPYLPVHNAVLWCKRLLAGLLTRGNTDTQCENHVQQEVGVWLEYQTVFSQKKASGVCPQGGSAPKRPFLWLFFFHGNVMWRVMEHIKRHFDSFITFWKVTTERANSDFVTTAT